MAKMIYTIGEVAELLGESSSTVRYWSNYFDKYVKPARNSKGNRLYHLEDLEALKQIRFLLKTKGMTLDGTAASLAADRRGVEASVKALDALKEIRAQLVEVKKAL